MVSKRPVKDSWISYADRTPFQRRQSDEFDEAIGTFAGRAESREVLERAIYAELETQKLGGLLPRVWQQTGSCVGASAARAYVHAMMGDVLNRGDIEQISLPFPYATYGIGRERAGMRRPGSGSYGAAQAWACENFGILPLTSKFVPRWRERGVWFIWDDSDELRWSHPSAWRHSRSEVSDEADDYLIQDVTRIRSTDEAMVAMSSGYGITLASSFGTRGPRIRDTGEDGAQVAVAEWNGSWAHQMSCAGYWKTTRLGSIFIIDNQWGPSAHPDCPTLSQWGVEGSFWITESTFANIIRRGEVFAHSNTRGFPARNPWGSIGL